MLCPRCRRENPASAGFCAACAAPLALGDDPPPRPLAVDLAIDRRDARPPSIPRAHPSAGPAPARIARAVEPIPTALPPPASRSQWDLGAPLAAERAAALAVPAAVAADAPGEAQADPDVDVGTIEVHLRRPATWRRAAAWAIDAVPFALLAAGLGRIVFRGVPAPDGIGGVLDLLAREASAVVSLGAFLLLAACVYATLGHALMGATLGKAALRLRVVGPDGERLALRRSVARSAAAVLSLALLGLGFLLALFTRSGRALHDWIAGTFVVERP